MFEVVSRRLRVLWLPVFIPGLQLLYGHLDLVFQHGRVDHGYGLLECFRNPVNLQVFLEEVQQLIFTGCGDAVHEIVGTHSEHLYDSFTGKKLKIILYLLGGDHRRHLDEFHCLGEEKVAFNGSLIGFSRHPVQIQKELIPLP